MRCHVTTLLLLFASASLTAARAAEDAPETTRPIAVNLIPRSAEAAYPKIREAYGALYSIVDVKEDDPELTPPKVATLSQNFSAIGEQPAAGEAMVVYVIATDGTVLLPVLVNATDATVGAALLESAARTRFAPARYHGEPVTAIGGQQLRVRPQGSPGTVPPS